MGNSGAASVTDIEDGSSHTLAIAEVTGGGQGSYRCTYWSTAGFIKTADGINGPWTVPGGQYSEAAGAIWGYRRTGASSYHPGGCHFTFADGSVHFLSENIAYQILQALTTRSGGEVIPWEEVL